jgi:hypothetical protein
MVGSFEAWCNEKRITRGAVKYIGEIRYAMALLTVPYADGTRLKDKRRQGCRRYRSKHFRGMRVFDSTKQRRVELRTILNDDKSGAWSEVAEPRAKNLWRTYENWRRRDESNTRACRIGNLEGNRPTLVKR